MAEKHINYNLISRKNIGFKGPLQLEKLVQSPACEVVLTGKVCNSHQQ